MTLYDFDWSNDDPWISKGEYRAAAFMHWFLIVLACGGAFVGSGEYGPCMRCEP